MPVITKISIQKNNQSRYNLFLDSQFAFGVDEDVLIKYDLKKGTHLTEQDLTEIQYEDEIRKAYHAAIQYLSFRMRSKLEIRQHLRKKEWAEEICDIVIRKLEKQQYTNDMEFAKAFVRTYANAGKKGPVVLREELAAKGIKGEAATSALLEYSEDKQVEDAVKQASKLMSQNKGLSYRMLIQKTEQKLLSKGYPKEIVKKAMEEADTEKSEESEWAALAKEADKRAKRLREYTGYEFEQRMKQALFRKGFPLDLISRWLEEYTADNE